MPAPLVSVHTGHVLTAAGLRCAATNAWTDEWEINTELDLRGLPDGWNCPTAETVKVALQQTRLALSTDGDQLTKRLREYYRTGGNFAGATFLELMPLEHDQMTASDLLAVTLLNVDISAYSVRRFLTNEADRTEMTALLGAVPTDVDLTTADAGVFTAMEELYIRVKDTLSLASTKDRNARVTAGKVCARKRPNLFPIRDRVVRSFLRLGDEWSWQSDWVVYRHLIGDGEIIAALEDAAGAVRSEVDVKVDQFRLRYLDVALWTFAR